MNQQDFLQLRHRLRARILPAVDRLDAILTDLEMGVAPNLKMGGLFERSVKRAHTDPIWKNKAIPLLVKISTSRQEPQLSRILAEIRKQPRKTTSTQKGLEAASRELKKDLDHLSLQLESNIDNLNRRLQNQSNAILDMDIPKKEKQALMAALNRDGNSERKKLRREFEKQARSLSNKYHRKYENLYQEELPPMSEAAHMSGLLPVDYMMVALLILTLLKYISQI